MAHEKTYTPDSKTTGAPGKVVAWTVSREISSAGPWQVSGVGVGSGTITLLDTGTPWKTPILAPGQPITIDARSDKGRAFSRIATMVSADIGGSALTDEKSFAIQDDMRKLLEPMRMPTLLPAAPVDASQAIVRICQKAGVPHDVQASGIMVPALLFDATTGWDAIQEVAEKTLGAAWMSETGTIVYRNAATMRGVGTPVETIHSLDNVEDVLWNYSDETVADRCTVTYTPFVTTTVTDNSLTVWESQKVIEIEPGKTVVLEQDFDGAADSLAPWKQAQDTSVPAEQYSRWNAAFSPDGGDAPPASVLTVTSTLISASRVRITLKSNAAQTLYVADFGYQSLILRANKTVRPGAPVTLETGNSEETARNTINTDLGLYAGTETKAKELLGWIAQQAATPRAQLDGLRVVPDPARRLGSLVQFVDPITGVTSKVVIAGKTDSAYEGALEQHLTLTLVPGTSPGPLTADVKITEPVGTSNGPTLAERQAFRDANADRTDLTPPPPPSTPVLSARLGILTAAFDGKTNTGSDMPSRVDYIQVAVRDVPGATTVIDRIQGAGGAALINGLPYNTTRYVRYRAVTYSGVAGPWSAEASTTVKPLVDTDLIGQILAETNFKDNSVSARTILSDAILSRHIKALAIEAGHLASNSVTTDKLEAGAVTAAKIKGGEVTADKIAFGVLESDHTPGVPAVRIGGQGVRLYDTEGAESVSLTATGSQFLTLKDSAGNPVATVDDTGGAAFDSLTVAEEARVDGAFVSGGDPMAGHGTGLYGQTINGRDILGQTFMEHVVDHPDVTEANAWLDTMPHGQILNAWHENGTTAETYDGINGEPHIRQKLQGSFEAKAGRIYQVAYRTPAFYETGTLGTTRNVGAAYLLFTTGSTPLGVSGASVVRGTRTYFPRGGGSYLGSMVSTLRCPEDVPAGQVNLGVTVYAYSGRSMQSEVTTDQNRYELAVTDLGMRASLNQGVSVNLSKQGTADPTPPTPPAPAKKEYTTTVNASWGGSYKGDNSVNTDANSRATQGRTPYWTSGGVQRGLIGFPSVTGTLSGADIVKVEVYVYAEHWHSSSGGTLCIGGHSHTSKPSTWSSNLNDAKRQALKKPEGRWITLPSSMHAGFKSGTYRGISILPPGSSTSTEYYGYLTWSKSKLRITYKK